MTEPKPLASLSSGLLARKGAARPAMRRQANALGLSAATEFPQDNGHDDLGWNDMGYDVDPAAESDGSDAQETSHSSVHLLAGAIPPVHVPEAAPVVPNVVQQRDVLAERIGAEIAPDVIPAPQPRPAVQPVARAASPQVDKAVQKVIRKSAVSAGRRAAFTLRIDAERHLRLRLACTIHGCSAQQLVIEAIDSMIAQIPELDDLARRMPRAKAG